MGSDEGDQVGGEKSRSLGGTDGPGRGGEGTRPQQSVIKVEERSSRRRGPVLLVTLSVALSVALAAGGAALAVGVLGPGSAPKARPVRVLGEVPVTAMDLGVGFSNNSPVIVADPTEPRFLVMANRLDAPDFGCALQVSGDNGRSWLSARPVTKLPKGADKCYAPEAAFDANGVLYYLFVGLQAKGNQPMGAFLATSSDRGRTFSTPRAVLGPDNFGVRMAIDRDVGRRGRIHVVWLHATSDPPLGGFGPTPNPILAAHSDDGGATFSDPVQVSDPGRGRVVAPALALGPDDAVHVAYYDLGNDAIDYQGLEGPVWEEPWSVVLASSFDGGRHFAPGRIVDKEVRAAERVMLIFTMPPPALVAGRRGRVCLAWTDARHGDADVFSRCSSDRGQRWGPPRRVNDDPRGNGASQYLPRLALSAGGRLDAVFFDRRADRTNSFNNVYLTYSIDGGRTFVPNRRVSQEPSFSGIGAQYVNVSAQGQYEIGGRLGLLSDDTTAVVAWPDMRHSQRSPTSQDLVAARVAVPQVGQRNPGRRLAGAGLMVVGLALALKTALSMGRPRVRYTR